MQYLSNVVRILRANFLDGARDGFIVVPNSSERAIFIPVRSALRGSAGQGSPGK